MIPAENFKFYLPIPFLIILKCFKAEIACLEKNKVFANQLGLLNTFENFKNS